MTRTLIRPAKHDEAQALTELALRSKAVWGYDAAFMEACRPYLTVTEASIAQGLTFVAERDGKIVGMYVLVPREDCIELDMLFVSPDAIGQGVGRSLFDHAVAEARTRGAARMIVEAEPNALAFYSARGMRQYAELESTVQAGRMLPLLELMLDEATSGENMSLILHITARADWEHAQTQGDYAAPSLAEEGFIHCSTQEQVAGSANRYYAGRNDVLLLLIDPARLTAPLVYEPPKRADRADQLFPHIYGRLNLDAVTRVIDYLPDADGRFHQPELDG
jgi:uncharacterized protein (DUF952 family)/GNAT superfamily N-acetyltransferase